MLKSAHPLIGKRGTLVICGKEYEAVFSFNALCKTEEITKLDLLWASVIPSAQNANVLRALTWAGIYSATGEELDLEKVGDMIEETGTGEVMAQIWAILHRDVIPDMGDLDIDPEEPDRPFVENGPS